MGARAHQVRQEIERRLADVAVSEPFDGFALCQAIAASRGRTAVLEKVELPADAPCGLWLATDETDYLFVQRNTSELHSRHIVIHEAGHMLWEHKGMPVSQDELIRILMPNLDPGVVRSFLGRSGYSTDEEVQAESSVSVLSEYLGAISLNERVPAGSAEMVGRLEQGLAGRERRWARGRKRG